MLNKERNRREVNEENVDGRDSDLAMEENIIDICEKSTEETTLFQFICALDGDVIKGEADEEKKNEEREQEQEEQYADATRIQGEACEEMEQEQEEQYVVATRFSVRAVRAERDVTETGTPIGNGIAEILTEGYLYKRSHGMLRRWQHRYFVVTRHRLVYSSSEEELRSDLRIYQVRFEKIWYVFMRIAPSLPGSTL
jgi:hypothetical protein